jgi:hypothetical protein
MASLRRLRELDWTALYRHTGFHWEVIEHLKASNGAKVHSLRLSQKIRALAFRDGSFYAAFRRTPTTILPMGGRVPQP